jgi:hypothetical protein
MARAMLWAISLVASSIGAASLGSGCSEDDDADPVATGGSAMGGRSAGGSPAVTGGRAPTGGAMTGGNPSGGAAGEAPGGTGSCEAGCGPGGAGAGGAAGSAGSAGNGGGSCKTVLHDGKLWRLETLEEFCQAERCPDSLEQATSPDPQCTEVESDWSQIRSVGCGYTWVSVGTLWSRSLYFDEEGTLVAGTYADDIIEDDPCVDADYVAGEIPEECADVVVCDLCTDSAAASNPPACYPSGGGAGGGSGGEAGSGGTEG